MTPADIRKVHELSKKYGILYKLFAAVYKAEIYGDSISVSGIDIQLVNADIDKFIVCVPLSQIKKGLQPQ